MSKLEEKYSNNIRGAFETKEGKKQRKIMLKALKDYDRDKYADAIEKFSSLLDKCLTDRDYCVIQCMLRLCYNGNRQNDKAIEALRAAAERAQTDPRLWEQLGSAYLFANQDEKAMQCWEKQVQYCTSTMPWLNMAGMYRKWKRFPEALDCAEKARKINPREKMVYQSFCTIYKVMGDEEKAKEYFDLYVRNGGSADFLSHQLSITHQ